MLAFIGQYIAQINPIGNPLLAPDFQSITNGLDYFNILLPTLITIGFIVGAVVFIFIFISGAFQWITAGGDKVKLENARSKITHSIVGLVILLLVYFIIQLVSAILGINIGNIGFAPPGPTPPDNPPDRPQMCGYLTPLSPPVIRQNETVQVTLTATFPGAWSFWLAFYNEDNQAGPGGVDSPRGYCKELDGDGQCIIYTSVFYHAVSPPELSHTFTISYDDVDDPDLDPNWDGSVPKSFHISGYFMDESGNQSAANVNCMIHFYTPEIVQCANANPDCSCQCPPGQIPDPYTYCQHIYPSCNNDTCGCIPDYHPSPPNKFETVTVGTQFWLFDNTGGQMQPNPLCWNVDMRTNDSCTARYHTPNLSGTPAPCPPGDTCRFNSKSVYLEGNSDPSHTKTESVIGGNSMWTWLWGGSPPGPTPGWCFGADLDFPNDETNPCGGRYYIPDFEGHSGPCFGSVHCGFGSRTIYIDSDGWKVEEITDGNIFWKYKQNQDPTHPNDLRPVPGCFGVDITDYSNPMANCSYVRVFAPTPAYPTPGWDPTAPCYNFLGCHFNDRSVYYDLDGTRYDGALKSNTLYLGYTPSSGGDARPVSGCYGVDLNDESSQCVKRYNLPEDAPCSPAGCGFDVRSIYVQP